MMQAGGAPWLRIGAGEFTIEISARPGSSRRGVVRAGADGIVVAIHSAPDKGKANAELIEWLSETLAIPKSAIAIVRGAAARRKTIRIVTANPNEATRRLLALQDGRSR
ncbi:MAG: DUF167 domain-containing protein [Candidatus Binataceae bacterium]